MNLIKRGLNTDETNYENTRSGIKNAANASEVRCVKICKKIHFDTFITEIFKKRHETGSECGSK